MKIYCSYIDESCVVGTVVYVYAVLTSSGDKLFPIDKYLIEEIYINSAHAWQEQLQEAFQSAITNYPTTNYTIGVQIVDGCGQYSDFVTSTKPKDAEAIKLTTIPSGTPPNYDWSAELRLNTDFLAGDILTISLTGIPNAFTLDSISSITPATSAISVVGHTLVFSGNVPAGTYFVISGTFDDNVCSSGTVTLTISGDTITTNNVATAPYSGATWCPKFSLLKAGSTVLFNNSKTYLNVSGINGLLDDAPYQDLSLMATYSLYDVSNVLLASGTMLANNTDEEILASTLPTKEYYYYRIDITDSFGNMHKLNSWFYVDSVGNITDSLYQVTSLAYDNTTTTLSVGVGGTSWANLPVNDGSVDYLNDSSPELTGAGVASSWAINAALTTTWNALKVVRKNTLYPTRESYSISWLNFS